MALIDQDRLIDANSPESAAMDPTPGDAQAVLLALLEKQDDILKQQGRILERQDDIVETLKAHGIAVNAHPKVSRPISETLDEFCDYLKNGNRRSESTCKDYRRDVSQFVQILTDGNRETTTSNVSGENVYYFAMALTKAGQSENSVERKVYGVMAYWKFLARRKLAGPPQDLEEIGLYFKRTHKQNRVLSREEFERLCTPRTTLTTSTF